jgi:16S rRNA (guanine(966)-N(2))-methyltransferase RsmD
VREALFSILGNRLENSCALDLYAGTGAVAIEALSRGAAHVTCVESGAQALKLLYRNISECAMRDRIVVCPLTVAQFLRQPARWRGPYHIVFADPPYTRSAELEPWLADPATDSLFAVDSWLVIEHAVRTTLPPTLGRSIFLRRYRYGDTVLSLYARAGPAQP